MSKSKSTKTAKTYRVNLCLSPLVHGWLTGIASKKGVKHGGKTSVGRLVSDALESAYKLGASFVKVMQLDDMVYAKKTGGGVLKTGFKSGASMRKPTVSSPLNGKKTLKKEKKGA